MTAVVLRCAFKSGSEYTDQRCDFATHRDPAWYQPKAIISHMLGSVKYVRQISKSTPHTRD